MFEGETPKSVFEVGCSAGGFLEDFYKRGYIVGGLDINEQDVDLARKSMPKGKFFVHDAHAKWPLNNKSWDIVFSVGTLLYMEYPMDVMGEMLRVGRKVIIAERNGPNLRETYHKTIDRIMDGEIISRKILPEVYHQYIYDYKWFFKLFGIETEVIKFDDEKTIIKTL